MVRPAANTEGPRDLNPVGTGRKGRAAPGGRIAENVMHFARTLRVAGLPIGPDRVIDAIRALKVAGIARRDDFYWTLASVFLDRREQFETIPRQ